MFLYFLWILFLNILTSSFITFISVFIWEFISNVIPFTPSWSCLFIPLLPFQRFHMGFSNFIHIYVSWIWSGWTGCLRLHCCPWLWHFPVFLWISLMPTHGYFPYWWPMRHWASLSVANGFWSLDTDSQSPWALPRVLGWLQFSRCDLLVLVDSEIVPRYGQVTGDNSLSL